MYKNRYRRNSKPEQSITIWKSKSIIKNLYKKIIVSQKVDFIVQDYQRMYKDFNCTHNIQHNLWSHSNFTIKFAKYIATKEKL